MKTRKLLIRLSLVFALYHLVIGCMDLFANIGSGRALLAFIVLILGSIAGSFMLVGAFAGMYDEWFAKNTDPIINNICDFFNRRNGGCKE